MANKPGEANFFPDVPVFPSMGTFQPVYGKFDLTTYIQGASDYEIMAFLVGKYNACLEAYGNITKLSTDTITACKQLQDWINSWFDNLDVQEELNKKIDSMVADGSFGRLLHQTFDEQINQQTTNAVTAWLVANVTPTGSAVVVDKSLSIEGAAADAKATGNKINENENNIATLISNLNYKEKQNLFDPDIAINNIGQYDYNGAFQNLADWRYYKFPVTEKTTYTENKFAHIVYWKDDTYISGEYNSSTTDPKTVTTPAGCNYVTLSVPVADVTSTIFNAGASIIENASSENTISIKNKYESDTESKINNLIDGLNYKEKQNLFDPDIAINNIGQYDYNGAFQNLADWRYYKFPVTEKTTYTENKFAHIVYWKDDTYISGEYNSSTTDPKTVTTPAGCNYVTLSVPVADVTSTIFNAGASIIENASSENTISIKNKYESEYLIKLPYIRNERVICGKVNDGTTAYYSGIHTPSIPNKIVSQFIFEKGTNSGTVALISNPNGLNAISDITKQSLHLTLTNTVLQVDCLGEAYGKYYYHNLITQQLTHPIPLDGLTEVTVAFNFNLNNISVQIEHSGNTEQYSNSWAGDGIHTLADFIGNNVTFEHYCGGDRNKFAMPMFTYFETRGENFTRIFDYFEREDGVLSTTPSGQVYTLLTNEEKYSGIYN